MVGIGPIGVRPIRKESRILSYGNFIHFLRHQKEILEYSGGNEKKNCHRYLDPRLEESTLKTCNPIIL